MLITVAGIEHRTEQSLCSREAYVRMEDTNEQASKQTLCKVVCAIIKNIHCVRQRMGKDGVSEYLFI